MKRNVISWITQQVPAAQHALILTHNISFLFVQGILAPQLRAAGNPRLTIFADAMCARSAWHEDRQLLDGLGVRYRVVPVELGRWRRFHPKAILLANRERAALAVGSGNLTWGGMADNHEAWAFGVSDGEGAHMIAAFRDYMDGIVSTLPLPAVLKDTTSVIFDPEQPWVADLPASGGLLGTPSAVTLLDQISSEVGDQVQAVTVIAPYHDEQGTALATIARRWPVPVTCWLQAGHEGLTQQAAQSLPQNVTLRSFDVAEESRPSFTHAKILAFHRQTDVFLVVGSANCSRSALLSNSDQGNAELVAIDSVSNEVANGLFAQLAPSDMAPVLLSAPPAEEWPDTDLPPLRILAARQIAGDLEIAFRSTTTITSLTLSSEQGVWPVEGDLSTGIARIALPVRLRVVRLSAMAEDGSQVESADAWVDDEASLAVPATLRRVLNRLSETESQASDFSKSFGGILELFGDYLRDPEAARRIAQNTGDTLTRPPVYDPASVFAENFGRTGVPGARVHGHHEPVTIHALVEALFAVSHEPKIMTVPLMRDEEEDLGQEAAGDARPENQGILVRPVLDEQLKRKVRRALRRVEEALTEEAFVEARAPKLLGADIALAAILLVKGLSDGYIEPQVFRETSRRLWDSLFFGGGTCDGTVPKRLAGLSSTMDQDKFVAAMASSRLSAAAALWCMTEYQVGDAEALAFRLSAAHLHANHPWLFSGGTPEEVATEIFRYARALLSDDRQTQAAPAWAEFVRAGESLRMLTDALKLAGPDLRTKVKAEWLEPTEVVWAGGGLALPVDRVRRTGNDKAEVRMLGEAGTRKFKAAYIMPIRELIDRKYIVLPPSVGERALQLIGAI